MKTYTIRRYYTPMGTFGELLRSGESTPWLVTVERKHQWFDSNHPCIPEGFWYADQYQSPTHGLVWLLQDVPDRSMIEFHVANWPHELRGCIAPGWRYGVDTTTTSWGVFDSAKAFTAFMNETRAEQRIAFNIIRAEVGTK